MNPHPFDLLRPITMGLALALAAILCGFGMGIAFGLAEDALKNGLKRSAAAAPAAVYGNDPAKIQAVLDKSWTYYKRAHLHAGALGAGSVTLIVLMGFLTRTPAVLRGLTAAALGLGSLGYGLFWLLAGRSAPALGSTGAAKESLNWLAMPTSSAVVLGTLAVLVMLLVQWGRR